MATDGASTTQIGTTGDNIVDEQVTIILADGTQLVTKLAVSKIVIGGLGVNEGPVDRLNRLPSRDDAIAAKLDRVIELLEELVDITES